MPDPDTANDAIVLVNLRDHIGREVGISGWHVVSQERINGFAEATGDLQWIHTDPERARTESLHGTTIAHGFLTLSLLVPLITDAVRFSAPPRSAVNQGLEQVRFASVVPAESHIRARFTLLSVVPVLFGVQAKWGVEMECQETGKTCLTAEWLIQYLR